MNSIKALCLAAVAAVTAMAFIGTSSAFAEDEVVICKELIEKGKLCPSGKLWPAGSILLALAEKPQFLTPAFNVVCEDSFFEAETGASPSPKIALNFLKWEFGVLPTPKLGEGCTNCKQIHTTLGPGLIEVTEFDDFWFRTGAEFEFLSCPFITKCRYETGEFKVLIDHKGHHPAHKGENLARFVISELPLIFKFGEGLCPKEVKWDATYVIYLVDWKGESGLGWPALDLK